MFKLLIVDDEPLVCLGIKSMLSWDKYNIEIVGTAKNGSIALEEIDKLKPDIIISDIKMPLKSGLELVAECNKKYGKFPLFIILTSFEEFDYIKEAMKYQAIDYLIKPELTKESLSNTILKAINILLDYRKINPETTTYKNSLQSIKDKFFIRLYNNLFENYKQFVLQTEELNINFNDNYYLCINCKISESNKIYLSTPKLYSLCNNIIDVIKDILYNDFHCYITIMDIRFFTITISLKDNNNQRINDLINTLKQSISLIYSYFNVNLLCGIGKIVDNPFNLSESYYSSQNLFHKINYSNPIAIYSDEDNLNTSTFEFSKLKNDLRQAFEEFDTISLNNALSTIANYYEVNSNLFIEALDSGSNILYMAISLLPDGEKNISNIFKDELYGYRCIYNSKTTEEIVNWIKKLRDGTLEVLIEKRKDYKNQIVQNVKIYIKENLDKRLSLNDVAYIFNFNPNYLSHIFAKYSDYTFVEFTTKSKIDLAKELLMKNNYRINEVSEKLAFDNPLYFSKVFKKYVGVSPRDFQQKNFGGDNNETK